MHTALVGSKGDTIHLQEDHSEKGHLPRTEQVLLFSYSRNTAWQKVSLPKPGVFGNSAGALLTNDIAHQETDRLKEGDIQGAETATEAEAENMRGGKTRK